ncbi:hypothetical protein V1506DRAFT_537347 [Lipomyces tetrasporus]
MLNLSCFRCVPRLVVSCLWLWLVDMGAGGMTQSLPTYQAAVNSADEPFASAFGWALSTATLAGCTAAIVICPTLVLTYLSVTSLAVEVVATVWHCSYSIKHANGKLTAENGFYIYSS